MQGLYLKRSIWEKICPKTKALHFNGARVPLSSVLQNPLDELNDHEGSFFAAGTFGIGNTAGYYDRNIRGKFLRLDPSKLPANPPKGRNATKSSKEARGKEHWKHLRYEDFEPLRLLWDQYIRDLSPENDDELSAILARADLHGSSLRVAQARNPGMVRLAGTVIEETQKTFRIITADNQVKVLPKESSVFEVQALGRSLRLLGPSYVQRWSETGPKASKPPERWYRQVAQRKRFDALGGESSRNYYECLVTSSFSRMDDAALKDRKQIEKDLPRTFAALPPLKNPEDEEYLKPLLKRVLAAYIERGRAVGAASR
ncbi:POP4, partial [Symbiodinium microadriaticum]